MIGEAKGTNPQPEIIKKKKKNTMFFIVAPILYTDNHPKKENLNVKSNQFFAQRN
jgi:hypothetical protein